MDANKIYEQTMETLTLLVAQHKCPDGEPSIRNFCRTYGLGRVNVTASLGQKPGHDMSVGVFLRILYHLGKLEGSGITPKSQPLSSSISLRQYLEIDNTTLRNAILEVKFS